MSERKYSSTAGRTTLKTSISISDTSMEMNATTTALKFPSTIPYTLIIDPDTINEEIVEVTAASGGAQVTITRGVDGTTAVGHTAGAVIMHAATARDFREPQQHMATGVGVHNLSGTVVGTTDTQTLTNKTITEPTISNPVITLSGPPHTASSAFSPRGTIVAYGGSVEPTGWLLCNGAEYDKSGVYSALYAIIGNAYGQTNGSGGVGTTHFRVPNLVGKIPVGHGDSDFGANLGASGGSKTSTAVHTHTVNHGHTIASNTGVSGNYNLDHGHSASHDHTASSSGYANGNGGHTHGTFDQGWQYFSAAFTSGNLGGIRGLTSGGSGVNTASSGHHDHSVSVSTTVNTKTMNTGNTGTWNHSHGVSVDDYSGNSGASSAGVATIGNVQPYVTVNYIIKF